MIEKVRLPSNHAALDLELTNNWKISTRLP